MRSNAGFWICSMIAVVAAGLALVACGTPSEPSDGPPIETITISNSGVTPGVVSIQPGQRVRFVNNSSTNRQINSNPFPAHSDCPPINDVSLLTPGETKETGPLTFVGACGFHDHLTEGNPTFSGQILVGTSDPGTAPPSGYY